jgi:nicotinamide-nucleotide amidase
MTGSNPTLAPYAKQDGVHLRITAKADDPAHAEGLISGLEAQVRVRLGEAIYGVDDESPAAVVRRLLGEAGYTYALLEVGPSVVGSLSPMLGDAPGDQAGERSAAGVVFSVENLDSLRRILMDTAGAHESLSLEDALRAIHAQSAADVSLGVSSELTPVGEDDRLVTAAVEILLITPDIAAGTHLTRSRHTWKTQVTEVRRLVSLAAYNLLRLHLLKTRNRES